MSPQYAQCRAAGFTLVELMAVLAVVAITATVAVPAMQQALGGTRLRTESARLMTAINLARSEAISRNTPVSVCPSAYGVDGVAECSASYADGWVVFVNPDRDREIDRSTDKIVRVFAGLPAGYSLTNKRGDRGAADLISYFPDGSSRRNRTLKLCPPEGLRLESWSVVMNIVGRPRLARGWGQCP